LISDTLPWTSVIFSVAKFDLIEIGKVINLIINNIKNIPTKAFNPATHALVAYIKCNNNCAKGHTKRP
jgi:hypothetical protein